MDIGRVFVVGAGFMGNGIAQMSALAGYDVMMSDIEEQRLEAALEEVRVSLGRLRKKEKITAEQSAGALQRLSTTTALEDARDADLVVEAAPEKLEVKKDIFARLDGICPERTILATNTSAISITSIASATGRQDRVVGTHFFGPVPVMRLCEIIRGLATSDETFETADEWARSVGKDTVLVRRDHAGFIANRINIPGSLEAIRLLEEGIATPAEIDRAATFGSEQAVGPMQIMDQAGIDVSLNAAMAIYEDTGEPRFYPPPLMRRLVAAGTIGRKSGRGFYDWSSGSKAEYPLMGGRPASGEGRAAAEQRSGLVMRRILVPIILEAVRLVQAGVSDTADIDKASRLGFNFPLGPLELADNLGPGKVLEWARELFEETGDFNYFAPALLKDVVSRDARFRYPGPDPADA